MERVIHRPFTSEDIAGYVLKMMSMIQADASVRQTLFDFHVARIAPITDFRVLESDRRGRIGRTYTGDEDLEYGIAIHPSYLIHDQVLTLAHEIGHLFFLWNKLYIDDYLRTYFWVSMHEEEGIVEEFAQI